MIIRMLTLAGGIAGAAGLSQFPEYSQQYTQRLAGAVDELQRVVADFDASAAAEGLTREQALSQMVGTDFVERRRADMDRTISRSITLAGDLETLRNATPLQRFMKAGRFTDQDIATRALNDFKPAIPVTLTGLIFAAMGFVAGSGTVSALFAVLRWPFRRRRVAA